MIALYAGCTDGAHCGGQAEGCECKECGAARCARRYCGHRESGHGSIALDDADGFRGSEACQAWECDCEGFLEP